MRNLPYALCAALLLTACPDRRTPAPPDPPSRCDVDLDSLELFSKTGSGARARKIEDASALIGGQSADGRVGDVLLENDKLRVVIQAPGRQISPVPYGGVIVDADRARAAGSEGRDQFGRLGTVYGFGRTINVSNVEILEDGSGGGRAVVAASGKDALLDYVNVPSQVRSMFGPTVKFVVDPEQARNLRFTTYYVVSPGESRVRMLTAVCNDENTSLVTTMGDIVDSGGSTDFFNPSSCSNGFGSVGCTIDPTPWFGYQGDDVAYVIRSHRLDSRRTPTAASALLLVAGVAASIADGQDSAGFLSWLDPQTNRRPGAFGLEAGGQNMYLRDFFVGRDLGEITSVMNTLDGTASVRWLVNVQNDAGAPAPGARLALFAASNGRLITSFVADKDGKIRADLPTGNYRAQVWLPGRALPPPTDVTLPSAGTQETTLKLGATRMLTVNVTDTAGVGMPAKVTVLCATTKCPIQSDALRAFVAAETLPPNVATVEFVPPSGMVQIPLPPGAYRIVVSRGPEYSIFPPAWPAGGGDPVDLTTQDAARTVKLARVVNTTGWMSSDLHVHAVASADSSVRNDLRVLNFAAEGVDVLLSSDHDAIVDYSPTIRALGAEPFIASMVGDEVTTFDYGHYNAYPVTRADVPGGGAFDWAGGDGPSLRLSSLFSGLREKYPNAVLQMNHARGALGGLTLLRVDTATGASHADPVQLRMEPDPTATASNTKVFSENFDAFEVQNGLLPSHALLNDWMTLLSRGSLKAATAVSDTHGLIGLTGGYGRTFVQVGADATSAFDSNAFATALKARRAMGTNGPFMVATAQALDASANPTGPVKAMGETLSVPSGGKLRISVDVQAPEWMTFDVLELYSHADGREAVNGEENATWPDTKVLQSKTFDVATLPREIAEGTGPDTFLRIHVTHAFDVTPTKDTWYVVMLRSTTAANPLFPLAYDGVICSGGNCQVNTTRPAAFTNAILVDADGSGAYDDFPLKVSQGLRVTKAPPPSSSSARRVPSLEELEEALRERMKLH